MSVELPAAGQTARLLIQGPAGDIEAQLSMPRMPLADPVLAVVCHPHPLYGGTLDNKVTYTLARAAAEAGCMALRFNFRGVGASTGLFDNGEGETEDALAVLDWGLAAGHARRFILCGFSFGGYVAHRAALQRPPLQLVTVAPALSYWGSRTVPRPDCPWLLIHSEDDDVVDFTDTAVRVQALSPPVELRRLQGAGHFFHGRLGELRALVSAGLRGRLGLAA